MIGKYGKCHCQKDETGCTRDCSCQCASTSQPQMAVGPSQNAEAGLGLYALETIKKDWLIGVYCGEYIPLEHDKEEHSKRTFYHKYDAPSYIFNLTNTMQEHRGFVDAQKFGNLLRFANHSAKDANIVVQYSCFEREMKIAFWSKRRIKPEEELYIDYGPDFFN